MYALVGVSAVFGFIGCVAVLWRHKIWKRQRYKVKLMYLFPMFFTLVIDIVIAFVKTLQFEDRLLLKDVLFTALIATIFATSRVSQFIFFDKYVKYCVTPEVGMFLRQKTMHLFVLFSRIRVFFVFLEVMTAAGIIISSQLIETDDEVAQVTNQSKGLNFTAELVGHFEIDRAYGVEMKLIMVWVFMLLISAMFQVFNAVVLFTSIITDINILFDTLEMMGPIEVRNRHQAQLRNRMKDLKQQRAMITIGNIANSIMFLACLMETKVFVALNYFIPIMMIVFALKSPFQLKNEFKKDIAENKSIWRECSCIGHTNCDISAAFNFIMNKNKEETEKESKGRKKS